MQTESPCRGGGYGLRCAVYWLHGQPEELPMIAHDQDDEVEEALRELALDRSGKQPLRGVFARRALRAVADLSRRMEEPSLQEAISAPSDYGVLPAALEAEPGL